MTPTRRPATGPRAPRPRHVLPDGEHDVHARHDRCPCRPASERWTIEGVTTIRVVHRQLTPDPEPVPDQAAPESP